MDIFSHVHKTHSNSCNPIQPRIQIVQDMSNVVKYFGFKTKTNHWLWSNAASAQAAQGSMFVLWCLMKSLCKINAIFYWLTFFRQKRQSKMRRIANKIELNTRRNIKRPSFVAQSKAILYCLLWLSLVKELNLKWKDISGLCLLCQARQETAFVKHKTLMIQSLINHWHALTDGSFTKSLMQGS